MTKITELQSETTSDSYIKLEYVRTFCKRMLKTQLFMGTFEEKRYVHTLNSYRDVVRVDPRETQFIENLIVVRRKLKAELDKEYSWIGITSPNTVGAPAGYCLWVTLPVEVFGSYWFKVKSVNFTSNEIQVKLEVVRPMINKDNASKLEGSSSLQESSSDFKTLVITHVTWANTRQSVIFLSVLIGTLLAGCLNLAKYLMEYLLKLINELSGLIKVCSPILMSCVELVGKTVHSLFVLILMLVRGPPQPQPQPQRLPQTYPVYNNTPMIRYDDTDYRNGRRRAVQFIGYDQIN